MLEASWFESGEGVIDSCLSIDRSNWVVISMVLNVVTFNLFERFDSKGLCTTVVLRHSVEDFDGFYVTALPNQIFR